MSVPIGFGTGYADPLIVLNEIFEEGNDCEFIEVKNNKVFRYVIKNGKIGKSELSGDDARIAIEQWGEGFLGSIGYEDWSILSPDSCHLFFPIADDFYTSYKSPETGEVRYVESLHSASERMKKHMEDLREDGLTEDEGYEMCVFLLEKMELAMKNKFVLGLS